MSKVRHIKQDTEEITETVVTKAKIIVYDTLLQAIIRYQNDAKTDDNPLLWESMHNQMTIGLNQLKHLSPKQYRKAYPEDYTMFNDIFGFHTKACHELSMRITSDLLIGTNNMFLPAAIEWLKKCVNGNE